MDELFRILLPEIVLLSGAALLLVLGIAKLGAYRAWFGLVACGAIAAAAVALSGQSGLQPQSDSSAVLITPFSQYIRWLTLGLGLLAVLLLWPSDLTGTRNTGLNVGYHGAEFLALALVSLAGVSLAAMANDLVVLILALELVSVPTYAMVSLSRPSEEAHEAAVKYFFLGALAVGFMLFGASYLYGASGTTNLSQIGRVLHPASTGAPSSASLLPWQTLGWAILFVGVLFKVSVVPMHLYVGDVVEGAASPVSAFLSVVPKLAGFAVIARLLFLAGGSSLAIPESLGQVMLVLGVASMFVGNTLALMQRNIKRMLGYSSVAQSGYMVAALAMGSAGGFRGTQALEGVLFYLLAYSLASTAAFGTLMLLPSASDPQSSAETLDDVAGSGRAYPVLGVAMAIAMLGLTGIPLTAGFLGKVVLIKPMFASGAWWLVLLVLVNAAVSAGYYLKVVSVMFLRPASPLAPQPVGQDPFWCLLRSRSIPAGASVCLATIGALGVGSIPVVADIALAQAKRGCDFTSREIRTNRVDDLKTERGLLLLPLSEGDCVASLAVDGLNGEVRYVSLPRFGPAMADSSDPLDGVAGLSMMKTRE